MRLPVVQGVIDRRILANFRVDPDVLGKALPEPFRPKLVHGWGMAGICLIRLRELRPRFVPPWLGISSENAAHRIAVEWEAPDGVHQGVYIPRRDTTSQLNALVGGRLFPGSHSLASFEVREDGTEFFVKISSRDGETRALIDARVAPSLPAGSVFQSIEEASAFFEAGSLGYSDTAVAGEFDGLELRSFDWRVRAMDVLRVESSYFSDPTLFPHGSAEFDSALLMNSIEHQWHTRETLSYRPAPEAA